MSLWSKTFLPAAACAALLLIPGSAEAASRPTLVSVSPSGQNAVTLRWSAPVTVVGARAKTAFDARDTDGRRIAVRSVRVGARGLVFTRKAAVARVRYVATARAVRGASGKPAAGAVVEVTSKAAQSVRPRPPRVKPTPTPTATPARTPAPTAPPTPVPTATPTPTATASPTPVPSAGPTPEPLTSLRSPIGALHLNAMPFGTRSFWLQPWRAYTETVPGTVLRDAVGINFNVPRADAARTAKLLAAAGIRRARVEFGWDAMRFDDPTTLADPAKLDVFLGALKANGIRPLLLLNANHSAPGPVRFLTLRLAAPATAGSRTVKLQTADVPSVVPGRTGFNGTDWTNKAADVLITAVQPDGTATLSKPLPRDLVAGGHAATTLRFAPFGAPVGANGQRNPAFEHTLAGWLHYVAAVTTRARSILGSDAFDVEVWNELSFGSDFLNAASYYTPLPAELAGTGDTQRTLLERTVAFLRDPANGVPRVGIGDGFASETPWPSGATEPVGVTAIDKHPYASVRDYPANQQPNTTAVRPDGEPATWTPSLRAFFPEYWLSGLQTETLIRDLSPFTTSVYGTPHGRNTAPAGGTPLQMWITESGMDLADGRLPQAELTAAAKRHILTKGVLRSLVAHVNKGVTALHFYAARGDVYGMVDEGFFAGGQTGGQTLDALTRLTAPFAAAQSLATRRTITLDGIADRHGNTQFAGDGTAAHPPLYDRDVVAVLPFQLSATRFAIPAYVMTRDLTKLYRPALARTDNARWDLPAATYRLALGGLASTARFTAQDPLTGSTVPVTVISRANGQTVIELPLTDSPRVILADDA